MPHEAHRYVPISDLSLGLNTQDPPSSLGLGELQEASDIYVGDGLAQTSPGFRRVLQGAPNVNAYRFNGHDTYLRAGIRETGSNLALQSTNWAIEVFFRLDSLPQSFGKAILLYRGVGESAGIVSFTASKTDFCLYISTNTTTGLTFVSFYGSTGGASVSFTNSQSLTTGTLYRACVTQTDVAGVKTFTSYVHEVGTSVPSSGGGGNLANPINDSGEDVLVGAALTEGAATPTEVTQLHFRGVIQELRFWGEARSSVEQDEYDDIVVDDTDADLVAYYPMTGLGTDTYFLESSVGAAGDGSGESPLLAIEPRDLTWRTNGHILGNPFDGTSTIDIDGRTQGIDVQDAYLYRQTVPDDDGGLPFLPQFFVSAKVKIRKLVDRACIFHSVHVPSADWTDHDEASTATATTFTPAETGQCLLEVIDTGSSAFRFRFIIYHVVSGVTKATPVTTANNLSAGMEYTISAWINGAGTVAIKVNSDTTVTGTMTGAGFPPVVTDDYGQSRKYRMTIGKGIKRTRQQIQDADANASDIEYEYSRFFDGEIRQVILANVTSANFVGLHAFNRDETPTRSNIQGFGLPIYSAWAFDDQDGDGAEDLGVQQNPLSFTTDSGHVWGHSILTTADKAPWRGLFDYRYRQPTGEAAKKIGIAAGSVYELDFDTRAATFLTDGFRNDDGNLISGIQHLDSLILCAGGKGAGNYQLYKDSLYTLAIEPPEGVIPIGLEDQLNDDANLKTGVYQWGFAFYSATLNKWSPLGANGQIEIKGRQASIAFGDQAEMNQTYASSPWSEELDPFDFSTATSTNKVEIRMWSWYGSEGDSTWSSGPTWWEDGKAGTHNPTKRKTLRLAKGDDANTFFIDSSKTLSTAGHAGEEVSAEEMVNFADFIYKRVFIEQDNAGRIRIRSVFAGENSFLTLNDGDVTVVANGGRIDWSDGNTHTFPNEDETGGAPDDKDVPFRGTGDSSHGLTLPVSSNPQVTHLGYFRSVAGGTDLRLVYLLPNGTTGFKDNVEDALNTGEVFDVSRGTPPSCRFVTDFENRAIYCRDALNPQRVYFSEFGDPANVPPQNFVDILDGGTLPITSVGRTEGGVVVTKDEAVFVLSEPTNPIVPFDITIRSRDIGGTSAHGIINVHENLFFPSEKGFYRFDLSYPEYLSERIEPTWAEGVAASARDAIVVTHDRRRELVLWAVPSGATSLGGATINDRILCLHYTSPRDAQNRPGGWTVWNNLNCALFATMEDPTDGTQRNYFADDLGYVYRFDIGENYGVGSDFVALKTVVSGTASTVTIPEINSANHPEGARGFFVTLVRAADNSRETRLVTADSLASPNSALTVASNWTGANPTSGDSLLIGSREAGFKTGEMSPFGAHVNHILDVLFVRQTDPGTASNYAIYASGLGGVKVESTTTLSPVSNDLVDRKIGLRPNVVGRRLTLEFASQGTAPLRIRDLVMKIKPANDGQFDELT